MLFIVTCVFYVDFNLLYKSHCKYTLHPVSEHKILHEINIYVQPLKYCQNLMTFI